MRVSVDQVASLRALLRGDVEDHKRIESRLDPALRPSGGALISAAFFKAAERKFANGADPSDVPNFVSGISARYGMEDDIDPRIAERILLATFTDEEIDDIDSRVKGQHFLILLGVIIKDADLSDAELDAFLEEARKLADEWLSDAR
jgi:hypothetical protein